MFYLLIVKILRMKKNYSILLIMSLLFFVNMLNAQEFVNQVLIGSGGIYGNEIDHVMLSSYSPDNGEVSMIGGVMTQSIQDFVIDGDFAYVAAQDSIGKFNVKTNERVGIIACSNLNQMLVKNEKLYVSRWMDPEDGAYVKIFDANDLTLLADVEGISGDAADLLFLSDTLYVAINGGWAGTEGKLAIVDNNNELNREIDFGTDAVGIFDLFTDGEKIFSVNRSPWGVSVGSITTYDIVGSNFENATIDHSVGKGFDMYENVLYFLLDGAIASYDLVENSILEEEIVAATNYTFSAASYDHVNNHFYVAETDYTSYGNGSVYDNEGQLLSNFEVGVSTEIIKIDYKVDIDFDNIDYWIGNGQKQAIVVVDWNDGNLHEALAWGIRWDGQMTAEEMLILMGETDERLTVKVENGFLNTLNFTTGYCFRNGESGFEGKYWATFSGSGSTDWELNNGVSTVLSDGDWFGCSFTDFNPIIAPEVPTPVTDPVGVSEQKLTFTLAPNPTERYMRIETMNLQKVEIYNLHGTKILERINSENVFTCQIDMINIKSGIYIVKVYTSQGVSTKKIIKQ